MAKREIGYHGWNYGTTFGRIPENWDASVIDSGRRSSSTASRSPFPPGEGIAFHHPYKHQLICSVGRRKKLPATQAGSPEARNSCNFSVVSEIAHINDRLAQKCALVPPEWDAHQRLLLEEKLSREARLMWCYRGTFSPKCPDHRNCVPHTTSAPGCGLGHLLLKEKAWALPRQWNQRTAVIR